MNFILELKLSSIELRLLEVQETLRQNGNQHFTDKEKDDF